MLEAAGTAGGGTRTLRHHRRPISIQKTPFNSRRGGGADPDVATRDQDRALDFYTNVIGLKVANPRYRSSYVVTFICHPSLKQPVDPDVRIWRFIKLIPFLHMIHSGMLHVRRADAFLDDEEEGMPRKDAERRLIANGCGHRVTWLAERRADYYVTCWTLCGPQTSWMWRSYAGDSGVAIESTWRRLQQALEKWPAETCYIGLVEYGYDTWNFDGMDADIRSLLHKRPQFANEREVRGLIRANGAGGHSRHVDDKGVAHLKPVRPPESSMNYGIRVDLDALLTRIYVAPTASPLFHQGIEESVRGFGHNIEVSSADGTGQR
jgi:hypothetical protein